MVHRQCKAMDLDKTRECKTPRQDKAWQLASHLGKAKQCMAPRQGKAPSKAKPGKARQST
jgi:hypothetical protein